MYQHKPYHVLLVLFIFGLGLGFASQALAKVVCVPIYGGGEHCTETLNKSFAIKKEVRKANETIWHENIDDVRDNETLEFKITVTNTGETAVDKLVATDFLPSELTSLQEQLGWDILDLKPKESQELLVKATTGNLDKLDLGEKRCVVNTVELRYQGQIEASDTATVCLKRGEVKAAEKLPETASWDDPLFLSSLASIVAGLYLRKKYY